MKSVGLFSLGVLVLASMSNAGDLAPTRMASLTGQGDNNKVCGGTFGCNVCTPYTTCVSTSYWILGSWLTVCSSTGGSDGCANTGPRTDCSPSPVYADTCCENVGALACGSPRKRPICTGGGWAAAPLVCTIPPPNACSNAINPDMGCWDCL